MNKLIVLFLLISFNVYAGSLEEYARHHKYSDYDFKYSDEDFLVYSGTNGIVAGILDYNVHTRCVGAHTPLMKKKLDYIIRLYEKQGGLAYQQFMSAYVSASRSDEKRSNDDALTLRNEMRERWHAMSIEQQNIEMKNATKEDMEKFNLFLSSSDREFIEDLNESHCNSAERSAGEL